MYEHKKLFEICDKIDFDILKLYFWDKENEVFFTFLSEDDGNDCNYDINVREVIFTEDFINKLNFFLVNTKLIGVVLAKRKIIDIMYHLDNPVDYIYDLIFE